MDHPRGDAAHLGEILEGIEAYLRLNGIPEFDQIAADDPRAAGLSPAVRRNWGTVRRVRRLAEHWSTPTPRARVPTAQNDPTLVRRHEKTHEALTAAGVPMATLPERVALLIERERRGVLDARSACAAAVDLVAARFEKIGLVDATAAARECAVVVRTAEPGGLRPGEAELKLSAAEREKLLRGEFGRGSVHIRREPNLAGIDVPAAIASGRLDGGVMDALKASRDKIAKVLGTTGEQKSKDWPECRLPTPRPVVRLTFDQSETFRRTGECRVFDAIYDGTKLCHNGESVTCIVESKGKDSTHEAAFILAMGTGNHPQYGDGFVTWLKRAATGGVVRPRLA